MIAWSWTLASAWRESPCWHRRGCTLLSAFQTRLQKAQFFFKPQQRLGNDFVTCLFQKDTVFPQHFKAQTCARCICLKWVLHTVLSLNQEPSSDHFAFPSLSSCRLPALILSRLKSSPRSTLSLSNSISFNSRVSIFCRGPGSITQIRISTTSGSLSSSEVK